MREHTRGLLGSPRTCHTIHVCTHHVCVYIRQFYRPSASPCSYLPRASASLWNPHTIAHMRFLFAPSAPFDIFPYNLLDRLSFHFLLIASLYIYTSLYVFRLFLVISADVSFSYW